MPQYKMEDSPVAPLFTIKGLGVPPPPVLTNKFWNPRTSLPPLDKQGVEPEKSPVEDPNGHKNVVLKDNGKSTGSQQTVHLPPLSPKGSCVQQAAFTRKRCEVLPAISNGCKNIPDLSTINVRGVGIRPPHPPSGATPQIKPKGKNVLPAILGTKECGEVEHSQQDNILPPINVRGVGIRPPHAPSDATPQIKPEGNDILPATSGIKKWGRFLNSQHVNILPDMNVRGVGIRPPYPPSDVFPKIKPEGKKVLPATSEMKECEKMKHIGQVNILPPLNGTGLTPKPPQKKTQQCEPDSDDIDVPKWMLHPFQNKLSVENRDTFSTRCRHLQNIDSMMYKLVGKKSGESPRILRICKHF